MSYLEISDAEAAGWFEKQGPPGSEAGRRLTLANRDRRPRLHLLIGDSVARRADLCSRFSGDGVMNRARGGNSWTNVLSHMDTDVTAWQTAAAAEGRITGSIIIWMSGNDVYSRLSRMANFIDHQLATVGRTARAAVRQLRHQADSVVVLGPLPRPAGEVAEESWEATAADHLERTLKKEDLGDGVVFVPLGRTLTRKMGRNRHGLKNIEAWFAEDGIHLTPEGYAKVADARTLMVGAGQDPPGMADGRDGTVLSPERNEPGGLCGGGGSRLVAGGLME